MTKKIVMCDTMIWYDLFNRTESFDKTKYQYYGSLSNIADFLSSDKMTHDEFEKEKLKQAIRTMENEADEVIMVDPTSAGSSEWFKIGIDKEEVNGIRNIYHELLRYARSEVSRIVGPTIDGLIEAKDNFRKGSISTKRQLVDLFNSKEYSEDEQHDIIIANILRWLETEWNKMRGTDYSNEELANWEPIEVFVKSYAEFIKTININQPPNKNTMIDLLQLLYVRIKGSTLIWTKERKLLKKVRSAFPENVWKDIIYQDHISQNQ